MTEQSETQNAASVLPNAAAAIDRGPDLTSPEAISPASLPTELQTDTQPVGATTGDIGRLLELSTLSSERLDELGDHIANVSRQVQLGNNRLAGLSTLVNESRCKSLLFDLLRIQDLVDQFIRAAGEADSNGADACQGFQLLERELRQILRLNGLVEIPADGTFNPELHRAMRRVPTEDPAKGNRIAALLKPGFRSEQGTILRYAEVEVWYHAPLPQQSATSRKDQGAQP